MICLLRRAHEHEFLLDQRQGFEAGFCERQRKDCRIEPPLLQILEKLLRDGLARTKFNAGIAGLKGGHQFRQEIGRDRRDNAEAQTTQCLLPLRAHEGFELIDRAQDHAGALGKGLTQMRQPGLPPAALHQPRAKDFFEILDLGRKRAGWEMVQSSAAARNGRAGPAHRNSEDGAWKALS